MSLLANQALWLVHAVIFLAYHWQNPFNLQTSTEARLVPGSWVHVYRDWCTAVQLVQAKYLCHKSWQKHRSTFNFVQIKMCQKIQCPYFKFRTFFDTGKNLPARAFPSFSYGPHLKQEDVGKMLGFLRVEEVIYSTSFRQESHPGSRLDSAYLIKEVEGTCIMAYQREDRTASTELLTKLTWFTLPGSKFQTGISSRFETRPCFPYL